MIDDTKNILGNNLSPYLQQHKNNPVNWQIWSNNILEIAKKNSKPISKKKILSLVWHYASDADTHTVETHIYRLRKKIADKFSDEKFIQNNKEGFKKA